MAFDVKKVFTTQSTITPNKVVQVLQNGKIANLPTKNGLGTVTRGASPSALFGSTSQGHTNCLVELAPNKWLCIFNDYISTTYYTKAVVLTISGDSVLLGSITTVISGSSEFPQVDVFNIGTDKVLFTYLAGGGSNYRATCGVISVSGTTISVSSPTILNPSPEPVIMSYDQCNMTKIDDNKFLFVWCRAGYQDLNGKIVTIDGTSVVNNDYVAIETLSSPANHVSCRVCMIDSTRAIVLYNYRTYDSSKYYFVKYRILTISGNTFTKTVADFFVYSTLTSGTMSLFKWADNRVLFRSTNTLYNVRINADNTITITNTVNTVNYQASRVQWFSQLDNKSILLMSTAGTTHIVYADEGVLKVLLDQTIATRATGTCLYVSCAYYGVPGKLLCAYQAYNAGVLGFEANIFTTPDLGYFGRDIGIVKEDGQSVILRGRSKGHTGVTPGVIYYDANGDIAASGTLLGYAPSSTEIVIPDFITD
jgi:hypothetical protein